MSDILLTDKDILYLRTVLLQIIPATGSSKLIKNLRIKFDIDKHNESNPNRSKIEIYNLAEATRSLFEDNTTRIVLQAGYPNTVATIFQGNITKARHKYDKVDIITTVELGDGDNSYRTSRLDKGYPPGISISQILDDIADSMSMPVSSKIGVPSFKYANALTLSGNSRDHLDTLTEKFLLEWTIQDEALQILPRNQGTDDGIVLLSKSSGLINSPEKTDEGIEFESLLYPSMRPGRRVQIDSKFIQGIYKIQKVRHVGDSLSGRFRTKCEASRK